MGHTSGNKARSGYLIKRLPRRRRGSRFFFRPFTVRLSAANGRRLGTAPAAELPAVWPGWVLGWPVVGELLVVAELPAAALVLGWPVAAAGLGGARLARAAGG